MSSKYIFSISILSTVCAPDKKESNILSEFLPFEGEQDKAVILKFFILLIITIFSQTYPHKTKIG
jgi:hypothetical protein